MWEWVWNCVLIVDVVGHLILCEGGARAKYLETNVVVHWDVLQIALQEFITKLAGWNWRKTKPILEFKGCVEVVHVVGWLIGGLIKLLVVPVSCYVFVFLFDCT